MGYQARTLRGGFTAAVVGLMASGGSVARAATLAWYQLGEADATNFTTGAADSSGNGNNLTRGGSPLTSSDTSPLAQGSTVSADFTPASGDTLFRNAPVTTATTGVAMEAWVKSDVANQTSHIALNGSGSNGYGLLQHGTMWSFLEGNISFNDAGSVTAGAWTHLGLTIDSSNVLRGYVNGVQVISRTGPANAPATSFNIGGSVSGTSVFDGKIDQVRVSNFTGAFDPTNFLFGTTATPVGYQNSFEPSNDGTYIIDSSNTAANGAHAGVAANPAYNGQATDGTNFLSLNGGNAGLNEGNAVVLSRAFQTGLGNAGTVSFDFGSWGGPGTGTQSILIELLDATTHSVYFTTTVSDSTGATIANTTMSHYAFAYTAGASLSQLRITDTSAVTGASDGLLDNIIVTTWIPEPASVSLFGVFGLIASSRRNRK